MVIARAALDEFFEQPRDNYTWIKDARPEDVSYELLRRKSEPVAKLRAHQLACYFLGISLDRFLFFLDMGAGKTLLSIELARYYIERGMVKRVLVCVPTREIVITWEDELRKWADDLEWVSLVGSSEDKWDAIASIDEGICVGTYAGVSRMVTDNKKNKLTVVDKLSKRLVSSFQGLILDESTAVGNRESLNYRVMNRISKVSRFCYALAGIPFGRDPITLWSQFFLVDRGESLGETLGIFREAFFTADQTNWGIKYEFDKRMQDELARCMAHRSIRYGADECGELPELSRIKKRVFLSHEAEVYHKRIVEELIEARKDAHVVQNVFLRMRQISSGFIGYYDEEYDERAEISFEQNPKLDLLMELVEEIPEDRKAVIFYEFNYSGRRICEEFRRRKIKCGWIWGGMTEDSRDIVDSFNHDPSYRFIIANWRKGGKGMNLQIANYTLVYESPVSPIERAQMERRTWRSGQERKCFLFDCTVAGTVDDKILRFHAEGRDLQKIILEDPEELLRKEKS